MKKHKAWDKDREIVYKHRLDLGKIHLVSHQLKTELLSSPAHLHSMLNFTPEFMIPLPPPPAWVAVQGHGEQELWLVPNNWPLLLLPSLTFPTSAWGPSHGIQPSGTAPALVLSTRRSPSGRLLQQGVPMSRSSCTLLLPGLSTGSQKPHNSWSWKGPGPTPSQGHPAQSAQAHIQVAFEDLQWGDTTAFPGKQCQGSVILTASFRLHPPAPPWAPPQALVSSPAWYPWAAGGEPALLWPSPEVAGDFCSSAWSTSSISDFSICPAVHLMVFYHSLSQLLQCALLSFLRYVSRGITGTADWLNLEHWQDYFEASETGSVGQSSP